MFRLSSLATIDYLVIGHLSIDLTPQGPRLGGTAAYSALTAQALGMRVGIITSWSEELPLGPLAGLPIVNLPAERSTTFENKPTPNGRQQKVLSVAPSLGINLIPDPWLKTELVHLGPIAQEVDPTLVRYFPAALVGVTPQGYLREWSKGGIVSPCEWPEASFVLNQAGAAVISVDDVGGDEHRIEEFAASCRILAVTENVHGARLYWNGDVRHFEAAVLPEVDATGAGDVFAAAFFFRLYTTRDPWEAARFATQLASFSVTRSGLDSIPTPDEIQECMVEVF